MWAKIRENNLSGTQKVLLLNNDENIVAKGQIAHYEQFRHLSQCFQMLSAAEASKTVCIFNKSVAKDFKIILAKI